MTAYEAGALALVALSAIILVAGLLDNRRADRKARREAFHAYWRKR